MTETHNNQPRPQYYNFAHIVLPEIFSRDAVKFMATMTQNGAEFLQYVWKQVGEYEKATEPTAGIEQISVENHTLETAYVAIITLPQAINPTEAFFCAIVHNPISGENRYFTLELGQNLNDDIQTILGEWDGNRHLNHGTGSPPNPTAFYKCIIQQLND